MVGKGPPRAGRACGMREGRGGGLLRDQVGRQQQGCHGEHQAVSGRAAATHTSLQFGEDRVKFI